MRASVLVLLAACATEPDVAEAGALLPDALAAAPLGLVAGPLTPGERFTLTASGATPGDRVYLAASDATRPPRCPAWMKGACGSLVRPTLLGMVTADRSGTAGLTVPAPATLQPGDVWRFQAIAVGPVTGVASPVLRATVQAARDCTVIVAEFEAETEAIRACRQASDCGTVLHGTSCGCTREWVARAGVDTTAFYERLDEAAAVCGVTLGSTCDCPPARGFDCVANTCTWNDLP